MITNEKLVVQSLSGPVSIGDTVRWTRYRGYHSLRKMAEGKVVKITQKADRRDGVYTTIQVLYKDKPEHSWGVLVTLYNPALYAKVSV